MLAKTSDDEARALNSALDTLSAIKEMVEALAKAEEDDDDEAREKAEQIIHEDPLSLQIRSGWYQPGQQPEPEEYELLLATGGPAVRIVGTLGEHNEPATARLQFQDWFIPWKNVSTSSEDDDVLLRYASCFYYGE